MTVKSLINVGTVPNDGTGDQPRTIFQKLNSATASKTYVATSAQFGGATKEATITATITAAVGDGVPLVRIPLLYDLDGSAMLPYNASLVTFNSAVRVTAEGYDPTVWNVRAYGAAGDGSTNDQTAIQTAINHAAANSYYALQGNVVYFPPGKYSHTATIQVPIAVNQGQVILRGAGMRVSYLYPTGASTNFTACPTYNVCLLFGSTTPDASGTTTNNTQYCGMENLSANGSLISSGSVVGVQFTQMQKGWITNSILEAFPNSSIGLYLRGSTVTGGLGTSTTAPHCWRNSFSNCAVSNIGSGASSTARAVVLQNADENYFENCVHGIATGLTATQDTLFCTWVQLGRNNIFVDCLQSGERTSLKTAYVGMVFGPPQNEAAVANGSVIGNVDYGAVMEGFDICAWTKGDSSGNTLGNSVLNTNPSIYNTAYQDDTASLLNGGATGGGQGGFVYEAPLANIMYRATAEPSTPTCTFANNSTSPSIGGSNSWVASNGSATRITTFTAASGASLDGRRIVIRATNGNTTIGDSNNGGGGNIRTFGRQDIVLAASQIVELRNSAGIWYQVTPVRFEGGAGFVYGAALSTSAIRGFMYLPTCAGAPVGTPNDLPTGAAPFVVDTSTPKIWFYVGGTWKGVGIS